MNRYLPAMGRTRKPVFTWQGSAFSLADAYRAWPGFSNLPGADPGYSDQ